MDLLVDRPTQAYGVRSHHASWQMQTRPGRPLSSIEVNALEATQLQKVSTMPNTKCINNGHNSKDNHSRGLGVQALKATPVQKKPVTSNARTRKQNVPADEIIDPRRSACLNTAPKPNLNDPAQQSPNTANASQAQRILATTETKKIDINSHRHHWPMRPRLLVRPLETRMPGCRVQVSWGKSKTCGGSFGERKVSQPPRF
jgi:hypothetical protein